MPPFHDSIRVIYSSKMFLTNYQSKGQTPHHMDLRKDKSAIEIQGKKQDLEAEVANLEDLRVAVNDQSSYAFNAS